MGAASVRYDEFLRSGALTVSPALRVRGARGLLAASGSASLFQSGSVSLQGDLSGSGFTRSVRGLSLELSGSLGLNSYRTSNLMAVAAAGGYAHLAGARAGARAGGLAGYGAGSFTEAVSAEPAFMRALVSAWVAPPARGAPRLELSVTPTYAGVFHYRDVQGTARWSRPTWELVASAGARTGAGSLVAGAVRRWVDASAAYRLTRRVAVVAAGGSYPPDLAQGIPGARYAALSARIASRPRITPARGAAVVPVPFPTSPDAASAAFLHVDAGGGRRTIRLRVPESATTVELMGDFTGWEPVALARAADGLWEVTVPLAPGAHRVNVRVDGGDWTVPDGLARQEDDFGGAVGVFTVR